MGRFTKPKVNRYGGRCIHCHRPVLPGAGNLVYSDTSAGYKVKHPGCVEQPGPIIVEHYEEK